MRTTASALVAVMGMALCAGQSVAQTASTVPVPAVTPAAPQASMSPDAIYSTPTSSAHWRSSDIVGKPLYSENNERIGEIEEILFSSDGRVTAAIVSVGGFLGMGERKVALTFAAIRMSKDSNGNHRMLITVDRDALRAAPEYRPVKVM
jgi:hypothetical protein